MSALDHIDQLRVEPSTNRPFVNTGATELTAYSAANSTSSAKPL
jgi:hypothetical protein